MPRITRVYTRTGDDGTTGLGVRVRVRKDDARVEAYGTVDELNSALGVVVASGPSAPVADSLRRVQQELFHLGSDLCVPPDDEAPSVPRIEQRHVEALEKTIDQLQEELEPLANFVLPGGCAAAAALHLARTICRRAERRLVTLAADAARFHEAVRLHRAVGDRGAATQARGRQAGQGSARQCPTAGLDEQGRLPGGAVWVGAMTPQSRSGSGRWVPTRPGR